MTEHDATGFNPSEQTNIILPVVFMGVKLGR
jgi:hypothetical protein